MANRFDGLNPEVIAWWSAHLTDRPIVVIQCAECRRRIGEIKRDGERIVALRKMVQPEPTVPRPQLAVYVKSSGDEPTEHEVEAAERELERRQAEHDTHVLRPGPSTENGRQTQVMKQRRDLADTVGPVSLFSSYCCPKHGEITVDKAHLAQFASESDNTRSVTRLYPIPYCVP
jgi:hypothetical protein